MTNDFYDLIDLENLKRLTPHPPPPPHPPTHTHTTHTYTFERRDNGQFVLNLSNDAHL